MNLSVRKSVSQEISFVVGQTSRGNEGHTTGNQTIILTWIPASSDGSSERISIPNMLSLFRSLLGLRIWSVANAWPLLVLDIWAPMNVIFLLFKYQRIQSLHESAIPRDSSFPEMTQLPNSILLLLFWDNGLGTLLELL